MILSLPKQMLLYNIKPIKPYLDPGKLFLKYTSVPRAPFPLHCTISPVLDSTGLFATWYDLQRHLRSVESPPKS